MTNNVSDVLDKVALTLNKIFKGMRDKVIVERCGPGHITVKIIPVEEQDLEEFEKKK